MCYKAGLLAFRARPEDGATDGLRTVTGGLFVLLSSESAGDHGVAGCARDKTVILGRWIRVIRSATYEGTALPCRFLGWLSLVHGPFK